MSSDHALVHLDLDAELVIFNMQGYSIHDGPGIRTVVFLKGCPLVCAWCSNPESQNPKPELGVIEARCQRCGKCLPGCPVHGISIAENERVVTNRSLCTGCGTCELVCSHKARQVFGRRITVGDLMREIIKDMPFYIRSGGGVTFSGGEPTLQHEALAELLKACQGKLIHTAIETCGYVPDRTKLESILEHLDLVLYDVKCIDDEKHKQLTGVSNRTILENARRISATGKKMIVRVPLIPGINDSQADIQQIGEFVLSLGSVRELDLLPYHELGKSKYEMLGKDYALDGASPISPDRVGEFKSLLESYGLKCEVC